MKRAEVAAVLAGMVLLGGCATKRYVADRVDPVNQKVSDVDQKQQGTQKQLDQAETKISAADEKANVGAIIAPATRWDVRTPHQKVGPGARSTSG